jgi:hypothetical protein
MLYRDPHRVAFEEQLRASGLNGDGLRAGGAAQH